MIPDWLHLPAIASLALAALCALAVAHFYIFRQLLGARLEVASVEFRFMMQIAMLAGFSPPVRSTGG